jgi:L-alanine-DL-glutamate epimerase-like enolase superfamily enzyme
MAPIRRVRPILLSAAYGDPETSMENLLHLPSGLRTAGFVEITLSDGTVGIGEGYLAVFAPQVFREIVELLEPVLIGRESSDIRSRYDDLVTATGYWSLQGAARHVLSAIEIALQDCGARSAGQPLWRFLGGEVERPLRAYASGGDSRTPDSMHRELEKVADLGIDTFKIRARGHQLEKARWTQIAGAASGISIAVDMTQNLTVPSQTPDEVLAFIDRLTSASGIRPAFLEEVLGPDQTHRLPELTASTDIPIAGGEIVTTPAELCERVVAHSYDIVQPDATVIGGLRPVLDVFAAARTASAEVYVHCWGAGVGVLANYHVASAGGGSVVEWPLPEYPLREELLQGAASIAGGRVMLGDRPGLGVEITPDIERAFPFREDAVYRCVVDAAIASNAWPVE